MASAMTPQDKNGYQASAWHFAAFVRQYRAGAWTLAGAPVRYGAGFRRVRRPPRRYRWVRWHGAQGRLVDRPQAGADVPRRRGVRARSGKLACRHRTDSPAKATCRHSGIILMVWGLSRSPCAFWSGNGGRRCRADGGCHPARPPRGLSATLSATCSACWPACSMPSTCCRAARAWGGRTVLLLVSIAAALPLLAIFLAAGEPAR